MVLGFRETMVVDGKTIYTRFEDKILIGLAVADDLPPKIHTVRKGNRWSVGKKIHFATGVRTSRYNQFAEGVCLGVQDVSINVGTRSIGIRDKDNFVVLGHEDDVLEFARNDGFDDTYQFWSWFKHEVGNDCFDGQIIHWTDFRYQKK